MKFMPDMQNEVENNKDDHQVYELGYLLVPTIGEDELGAMYGNVKELVGKFGGTLVSDEIPKTIPLAYNMSKVIANVRTKFNSAYFGWVKFTMDTQKILELKKKLDLDSNFIRFLILKTVKENTIAAKRFVGRDSAYRRNTPKKDNPVEAVPINREEIDKEIDAMVAV